MAGFLTSTKISKTIHLRTRLNWYNIKMNTSREFLNQNRLIGDPLTDNLVKQIFEKKEQANFYKLLQMDSTAITEAEDSELKSFLMDIRPLPQWFDAERILKGQKFYRKFAMPIMTLLGGLSLPYCYAASPGNKAVKYIINLNEVSLKDINLVGGKNASLGEMIQNIESMGIKVPNGFAVTTNAYRDFIDFNGLQEQVVNLVSGLDDGNLPELRRVGAEVRQLIRNGIFPPKISSIEDY